MNLKQIKEFFEEKKIEKFRLKQLIKAVYQDGVSSFLDISTLPKNLREEMNEQIKMLCFKIKKVSASSDKKSFKALLELKDGNVVETVIMSPISGKWSVCVSSQAGCALGCKFCATGASGFVRNLKTEEITDQVLFWKQYLRDNDLKGSLSNIVFMGMGEPFLNYEEVKTAINKFLDKELFGFAHRHISISTSGIPEGIRKMSKDFPQLNLAISIISCNSKKRAELMPISKKYNLNKISEALEFYFFKTNRKVFFEYIMIDGVNDSLKEADLLIDFINNGPRPELIHVNLIRLNDISNGLKASSENTLKRFKDYLGKNKISVTVRRSLGSDIKAACGQLAKENKK
jgi:23S rRNA (adenine(2503)-C(2))-methyltransferase